MSIFNKDSQTLLLASTVFRIHIVLFLGKLVAISSVYMLLSEEERDWQQQLSWQIYRFLLSLVTIAEIL